MDLNKDYYKILGVDKNADTATIDKAYKKLAKIHHPDREGGSEDEMQKINEAKSVLSGDERNSYDSQSQYGKNPRPQGFGGFGGGGFGGGINLEDLFKNGFGGFGSAFSQPEDLDLNMSMKVDFKDIYNNTMKTVKYNRKVHCSTCDGIGRINKGNSPNCRACNGTGRQRHPNGMVGICQACQGTGKIHSNCDACNGNKLENKHETLQIDFLYIVGGGHARSIVKPGLGNASKESINRVGDLNITLIPTTHKDYEQKGFDLYHTMKVDIKTAILGGNVIYTHLETDAKPISIKIPPKTKNGDTLRMVGKGMLKNREGSRGDFYINVQLNINYDTLTESDLKLIEKISF